VGLDVREEADPSKIRLRPRRYTVSDSGRTFICGRVDGLLWLVLLLTQRAILPDRLYSRVRPIEKIFLMSYLTRAATSTGSGTALWRKLLSVRTERTKVESYCRILSCAGRGETARRR
jgi:hypothetical protein